MFCHGICQILYKYTRQNHFLNFYSATGVAALTRGYSYYFPACRQQAYGKNGCYFNFSRLFQAMRSSKAKKPASINRF